MELTWRGRLRGSLELRACGALGLSFMLAACGSPGARSPEASAALERRSTRIVHEPCATESSDARPHDLNGDGQPDAISVFAGNRELCRALDLNFDGRIDVWTYRDAAGELRRRETDFDRDGRVDEISLYRAGQLIEQHQATTFRGRLDTWHYYEGGKLVRSVRDANGDRVVDQWWEYPGPTLDCARVHSDVSGDGRPDPAATVQLCDEDELRAAARVESGSPQGSQFGAPSAAGTAREALTPPGVERAPAPSSPGGQSPAEVIP